jgi:hypothetical protein
MIDHSGFQAAVAAGGRVNGAPGIRAHYPPIIRVPRTGLTVPTSARRNIAGSPPLSLQQDNGATTWPTTIPPATLITSGI